MRARRHRWVTRRGSTIVSKASHRTIPIRATAIRATGERITWLVKTVAPAVRDGRQVGLLGRQPPLEIGGTERAGPGDQAPGCVDLFPDVPQQHAPHPAGLQVVDHTLTIGLL